MKNWNNNLTYETASVTIRVNNIQSDTVYTYEDYELMNLGVPRSEET